MPGSIQPTGQQPAQNTAVENQSVGQFENRDVIDNNSACCKGLPEKALGGFFSLGRSLGRIWNAVKEGVSAFFGKLFGKKSKASTVSSGVKMNTVSTKKGSLPVELQPSSNMTASGSQPNVPYKPTVSPQSMVSQASACKKEKKQGVSDGSSGSTVIPSNSLNTLSSNASKISNKTVSEMFSTHATASAARNVSSSSPKYKLVDVPGNGNCGLYAVLVGTGALKASEFLPPPHADYGSHPLPNEEQEFFVQQLRSGAAKIAKEQLREKDGSYLEKSLETVRRLEAQHALLADDDFKYVSQVIGQPIEVYSEQPGGVARTLFQPNGETKYLLSDNSDPSDRNILRLYLAKGHYQLMQPIETV